MKTRFGAWRLGYAWMILEPLTHIGVFLVLFGFGMRNETPGMPFAIMLLVAFLPFFMFMHSFTSGAKAVTSNRGLLNYGRVKPVDTVVARIALEGIIAVVSFSVLLTAFTIYLKIPLAIQDPARFILTFILFWWFCLGCALNIAIVGTLFPESQKILPMITRPLYFVSGLFFLATDLPQPIQGYAYLNPVFHGIELLRDAYFTTYETPGGSLLTFFLIALTLNFTGGAFMLRFRDALIQS